MAGRRRLLVPEVVQTSAMDCGPAALKSLLEGFGIPVSYGRLREACQTSVDGTSIDTLEDIAVSLGLEAEQMIVPPDHVYLPAAGVLPALVVVLLPSGFTHFVVLWRAWGDLVQVMDPATGRQWLPRLRVQPFYIHTMVLPADAWRDWAASDEFLGAIRHRMGRLGVPEATQQRLADAACQDPTWKALSLLDATVRFVTRLVQADAVPRGGSATRLLEAELAEAHRAPDDHPRLPPDCFTARAAPAADDGSPQVRVRGAVMIRVRGLSSEDASARSLPRELAAALKEPAERPGRDLLRYLLADGHLAPGVLAVALLMAAGGLMVESILFRAFFDIGDRLGLLWQRVGAMTALLLLMAGLLALDVPIARFMMDWGRRLEGRLRMAFQEKIPKLGDQYFRSRLVSDMAQRCQMVHSLRLLPTLGGTLVRNVFELVLTTAGIIWLSPESTLSALILAAGVVTVPILVQPMLMERDLRLQSHAGGLSRFYLDALLGLVPVRTHGAENALRREHESLLVEWTTAGLDMLKIVVTAEGLQTVVGYALSAALIFGYVLHGGSMGRLLLLVYWVLNLPVLGTEIAVLARQYPSRRNVTLRLLEPLGALEEEDLKAPVAPPPLTTGSLPWGVSVVLKDVSVQAGGHTILDNVSLNLKPGSHVAIVGPSGAGKSSLVGLLLGWHKAAQGSLQVDGAPLAGRNLARLRKQTAWVDPAIHLWNRTMQDNLLYGNPAEAASTLGSALDTADLLQVLERLENGLQTRLGEGGGMVSGGEGQRVRLARAILRQRARLVLLDEPFRGLERDRRGELLRRAREWWPRATLVCVTHDVSETLQFDRVLMVEDGRIVEDGPPRDLAAQADSRFRALLDAEEAVRKDMWQGAHWRLWRVAEGQVHETAQGAP